MPRGKGTIFVSRKGTASADIDADPAYRAIYEARRRRRRQRMKVLAQWSLIAISAGVGILAYMGARYFMSR